MIGGWELLVILFVILILFGGKKLPEFARNLGKGLHEFKKAASGMSTETDKEIDAIASPLPKSEKEEG